MSYVTTLSDRLLELGEMVARLHRNPVIGDELATMARALSKHDAGQWTWDASTWHAAGLRLPSRWWRLDD